MLVEKLAKHELHCRYNRSDQIPETESVICKYNHLDCALSHLKELILHYNKNYGTDRYYYKNDGIWFRSNATLFITDIFDSCNIKNIFKDTLCIDSQKEFEKYTYNDLIKPTTVV